MLWYFGLSWFCVLYFILVLWVHNILSTQDDNRAEYIVMTPTQYTDVVSNISGKSTEYDWLTPIIFISIPIIAPVGKDPVMYLWCKITLNSYEIKNNRNTIFNRNNSLPVSREQELEIYNNVRNFKLKILSYTNKAKFNSETNTHIKLFQTMKSIWVEK